MLNKRNLIPALLLFILLSLFALHFIQYRFHRIKIEPLDGYYLDATKIKFSWKDWFSGSYQEAQDQYLNDHFGFRPLFVRLNHQLRFSLFNKVKTAWVIVGKDNYLYEHSYIYAERGIDFIGSDSISTRMYKFKQLQHTLDSLGKQLIIVLASGKGTFYPEYIPEEYKWRGTTNIEIYRHYIEKWNLNCIDFNQYFIDLKEQSPYPLYPQYGIHWSHYSACLVTDSLVRYIEKLRDIEMPHIYWEKINMSQPRGRDKDIWDAMNLFFSPRSFPMAYPEVKVESGSEKTKPSLLVVADSFHRIIYDLGVLDDLFTNPRWWYYNKEIYPDCFHNYITVNDVNVQEEILKYDVIMILGTDANLPNFGWGFIETGYDLFCSQKAAN